MVLNNGVAKTTCQKCVCGRYGLCMVQPRQNIVSVYS